MGQKQKIRRIRKDCIQWFVVHCEHMFGYKRQSIPLRYIKETENVEVQITRTGVIEFYQLRKLENFEEEFIKSIQDLIDYGIIEEVEI